MCRSVDLNPGFPDFYSFITWDPSHPAGSSICWLLGPPLHSDDTLAMHSGKEPFEPPNHVPLH